MVLPRNGFSLARLVAGLDTALFERYLLRRLPPDGPPPGWAVINGDGLNKFLTESVPDEVAEAIRSELGRVQDIADEATGTLVQAYHRNGIPLPENASPETLALLLFVDHESAWDYVWTWHMLVGAGRRIAIFAIPERDFVVGATQAAQFETSVRDWFAAHARGEQAQVVHFADNGESLFLIRHGSYLRTVPMWETDTIGLLRYRPAFEDVLLYDCDKGLLRIQASSNVDRDAYLRLFARDVVGDESVAEQAAKSQMYDFEPFRDKTFNYGGAGIITRVGLVQAQLRVFGRAETTVIVKSRDVLEAFDHDLRPLSLERGIIDWVRLRFELRPPGQRATSVTFTLSPPAYTDLRETRHARAILAYLEEQGVKLR